MKQYTVTLEDKRFVETTVIAASEEEAGEVARERYNFGELAYELLDGSRIDVLEVTADDKKGDH